MILPVNTKGGHYEITLCKGALQKVGEILDLNRKVLIVTDSGVPEIYAETVAKQCKDPVIYILPQGEQSKNFDNFKAILQMLLDNGFTRTDCVVAVGGGVVGDLAGFCAACFMRGIDFYNIPTTVLSQVDSSVGGKTAIDFCGVKNTIGAFYQPKAVIIDTDTLKTLPERQISNGLCESVKMALTFDKELFSMFETGEYQNDIEKVIEKSLKIKIDVVEKDEKESGLRKVLNFGHTVGHAIESAEKGRLYHGECVGIGMLSFCSEEIRERLKKVLCKLNVPQSSNVKREEIIKFLSHDKKLSGDYITVISVEDIGSYKTEKLLLSDFSEGLKGVQI